MLKALRSILCAWLSACAALTIGCSNKAAHASREKAAELSRSSNPPPVVSNERVEEQRVYLDASFSMAGFVNAAQHTAFDDFIEHLGDVMPGCRPYRYGALTSGRRNADTLQVEPVGFGLELHRPGFYNMPFNADDRLIRDLVEAEQANLSVVVTDGVYSEPEGATSPPVVQAIQGWMEKGRVFGIFVLRSAFNGRFYSERGRMMLPAPQKVAARPFYALVFSPTESALRDIQEKLQRRFPDMRAYVFADSAVSCAPGLNERVKGTYSYARPPAAPYYWHMFDAGLFDEHNPAPVGYNLKCAVAPDYPVSDVKLGLAADYYLWKGERFEQAGSPPPGFRLDLQPGKGAGETGGAGVAPPDFVAYYPRDQGGDYGFYHLRLNVSPKELRPEIIELSTRDDRQPQDAEKTYRFFELMSALSEVHFKSRLAGKTASSIFVTIQNH